MKSRAPVRLRYADRTPHPDMTFAETGRCSQDSSCIPKSSKTACQDPCRHKTKAQVLLLLFNLHSEGNWTIPSSMFQAFSQVLVNCFYLNLCQVLTFSPNTKILQQRWASLCQSSTRLGSHHFSTSFMYITHTCSQSAWAPCSIMCYYSLISPYRAKT